MHDIRTDKTQHIMNSYKTYFTFFSVLDIVNTLSLLQFFNILAFSKSQFYIIIYVSRKRSCIFLRSAFLYDKKFHAHYISHLYIFLGWDKIYSDILEMKCSIIYERKIFMCLEIFLGFLPPTIYEYYTFKI